MAATAPGDPAADPGFLLKDAGLVTERAVGTRRIYYRHERGIDAVQEYLERVWGEAAARLRLLAENTREPGQ